MMKIILDAKDRRDVFSKCCQEYTKLHMAVAWLGDPSLVIPYRYLEKLKSISATVGVTFQHTHPEGIRTLLNTGVDLRIFKNGNGVFHPKIYRFQKKDKTALILGSANFTNSGFVVNEEAMVFYEGKTRSSEESQKALTQKLKYWHSDACSFVPTNRWLNKYEKSYKETRKKQKANNIQTPQDFEESTMKTSWLGHANWEIFYQNVVESLQQRPDSSAGYRAVLESSNSQIPLPWTTDYLDELETRKLIGGRGEYGWFGNTTASGKFAGLLKSGTPRQKSQIAQAVNAAANLQSPIQWSSLQNILSPLVGMGFKMSTWGRLLCLARPDLYATVSSPSLRRNPSKILGVTQSSFNRVDGYVQFIKYLHSTPWFLSEIPVNQDQSYIWQRRVAYIDPIFH